MMILMPIPDNTLHAQESSIYQNPKKKLTADDENTRDFQCLDRIVKVAIDSPRRGHREILVPDTTQCIDMNIP